MTDKIIGHWWLSVALSPSPPQRSGVRAGAEVGVGRWHRDFQPSRSALLATRPNPYLRTKTHLMNITKGTCVTLITQEIPRVLETLYQKSGQGPNMYFLL